MVCLVTDRRRTPLVEQARAAVDAGVDLIQVRERDLEAADLVRVVESVIEVTRGSATRVLVNDRVDVALACRADGVHLRSDSVPPSIVRSIASPGFLIGRSVHHVDEARQHAGAADFLIAGTVFPTASKPSSHVLLGVDGVTRVAGAVRIPVLAIGGMTLDRVGELSASGVAGIAAIGMFAGPSRDLVRLVESIRAAFDSLERAS
jgi:thiamine-phosphate pyrophosphorylase